MKLVNPTDGQLNSAFAEHVAGWFPIEPKHSKGSLMMVDEWWDANGYPVGAPRFASSADAVLPWLEKSERYVSVRHWRGHWEEQPGWMVILYEDDEGGRELARAVDTSLPRAAVIALLRAHGVEVEFTQ